MRNDVKYIKRNTMGTNAANWSLVIDVFLVLLAFVLDRTSGDLQSINTLWIAIAICGVAFPVCLYIAEAIKIRRAEEISKRVLNAKELVVMFDDEICYMIMSAETFTKKLQQAGPVKSRQAALMLEFYTIEAEYYLNKAVHLILKMDNNLRSVLDETDLTKNHISKSRLVNAISLIASIYESLFDFAQVQSNSLCNYSVCLELSSAKEHYNSLKSFANRRNSLLGQSISSVFNV